MGHHGSLYVRKLGNAWQCWMVFFMLNPGLQVHRVAKTERTMGAASQKLCWCSLPDVSLELLDGLSAHASSFTSKLVQICIRQVPTWWHAGTPPERYSKLNQQNTHVKNGGRSNPLCHQCPSNRFKCELFGPRCHPTQFASKRPWWRQSATMNCLLSCWELIMQPPSEDVVNQWCLLLLSQFCQGERFMESPKRCLGSSDPWLMMVTHSNWF